jgi:hypothetical protein
MRRWFKPPLLLVTLALVGALGAWVRRPAPTVDYCYLDQEAMGSYIELVGHRPLAHDRGYGAYASLAAAKASAATLGCKLELR